MELHSETNGGDFYSGYITTIATYDGKKIRYYIKGENLDDFIEDIQDNPCLITFGEYLYDISIWGSKFFLSHNESWFS